MESTASSQVASCSGMPHCTACEVCIFRWSIALWVCVHISHAALFICVLACSTALGVCFVGCPVAMIIWCKQSREFPCTISLHARLIHCICRCILVLSELITFLSMWSAVMLSCFAALWYGKQLIHHEDTIKVKLKYNTWNHKTVNPKHSITRHQSDLFNHNHSRTITTKTTIIQAESKS